MRRAGDRLERPEAAREGFDLRGRVAIVTGGTGGIGRAISRSLADRGCRVVVAARDPERVRDAAGSIDGALGVPHCDVSSPASVRALFRRTLEHFGRLDVLVTCVGLRRSERTTRAFPDPVQSLPIEVWDETIDTNLLGAFLTNREAARIMLERGEGQILNISSARGARRGYPYGAGYCAAKHALNAMTQSLSAELEPHGVRVQCVLPDAVDTGLISGTQMGKDGTMRPETVGEFVVGLLERPQDSLCEEPVLLPFTFDGEV